jgi:hypothetical protein
VCAVTSWRVLRFFSLIALARQLLKNKHRVETRSRARFHAEPRDSEAFATEFARFAPIHHEYFPDHYPAWSAVGTPALLQPGAPVELRAVAIIGSGRNPRAAIPAPPRTPSKEP